MTYSILPETTRPPNFKSQTPNLKHIQNVKSKGSKRFDSKFLIPKSAMRVSFPFYPPDQYIHLSCKIRNHDDEKHQKKSVRIDDPQNIHLLPPFINRPLLIDHCLLSIAHNLLLYFLCLPSTTFSLLFHCQYECDFHPCQG